MNIDHNPLISILIPIRNEQACIKKRLVAVQKQNYPKDRVEILITGGMSDDDTRQTIKKFQSRHPQIQIFDNQQRIVSSGLYKLI